MQGKKILAGFAICMIITLTACGKTKDEGQELPGEELEPDILIMQEENIEQNAQEQEDAEYYEGDAETYYVQQYKQVLDRYYDALNEEWDGEKLLSEDLSSLLLYCYEGEALENVGYSFMDIDGDGGYELLLGINANGDFEDNSLLGVYTLKDNNPVAVFVGQERSAYYLCPQEEGGYIIANVASSGAANSAWYYYCLNGDKADVVQAIVYDASSNPDSPWYMAFDEDWDTTNDTPVDEAMAQDIIQSFEDTYTRPELCPFSLYTR